MKYVALLATLVWATLGMARAESPVVVELFTSQGCSSCPPADKILGEIAQRDDVIALALHVDYWDYIGWKDEFARPEHTDRQRAYSRAAGKRSIYTPQMVVGGLDHVVGTKPMKLADLIQKHSRQTLPVAVSLSRQDGTIAISAESSKKVRAVVQLVTFSPLETVRIKRGENAGRTLSYHNVVTNIVTVGDWDGRGTFNATAGISEATPVAVLIQSKDGGVMLGAAQLK